MKEPTLKEMDDAQQTLCDNFHEWLQKQNETYDPIMVHMTVLGQTIKILKSFMPSENFDRIMKEIYQSKDEIKPFKKISIH